MKASTLASGLALVMLRGCAMCRLFGTACAIQAKYPPKPRQGD